MSIERKLWLQIDSESDDSAKAQSASVLSDFLDETGQSTAARFLRESVGQPTSFYYEFAQASSLKAIIKKLGPTTARLFACNIILLDPSENLLTDFSVSIDAAINHEFGLTNTLENEIAQKTAYQTYLRVKSNLDSLSSRERRIYGWKEIRHFKEELWSCLRATGAISIVLNAREPVVDAIFTAKFAKLDEPTMIRLATEYLILARAIKLPEPISTAFYRQTPI